MMPLNQKRMILLLFSLVFVFIITRLWLHISPHTNFYIGPYNIHHLFVGLLFIVLGAIPLALFQGDNRCLDGATVVLGAGLSLALDQWVYLVATDGSDAAYLLPISLYGAMVVLVLVLLYILLLAKIKW